MIITELEENLVPCHIRYREQVFTYMLDPSKMSLDHQFSVTAIGDKMQTVLDHPENKHDLKALKMALSTALVPVIAEWEVYETPEDEAAGKAWEINAENLQRLPGPILIAMVGTLNKLTASDADADDPEVSGGA